MRLLVLALVIGASACTAAGSSTVISRPSDADGGTPTDPFASLDGGTSTTKDSGTTTTTDYESLFGPPSTSTTTPNSLSGLWAGTTLSGNDMRVQFAKSSILVAVQCTTGTTVGLTVAANVSTSAIKTLESKKVGQGSCTISITPKEVDSCVSASYPCFTLNGTKVDLADFLGETGELTKLSD